MEGLGLLIVGFDVEDRSCLKSYSVAPIYLFIQKFGFINGVDNVNWPPYRDSKS